MKTTFDYTMMNDFLTCRRFYDFRHNKGYRAKKAATALDFGGAIGKALDSWYEDKDVERAIVAFREAYQENLEIDDKRTWAMGEWIIRNYDEKYRDQAWKLVATEMNFAVPLSNGNKLAVKVDKVISWDGIIWGVDHKTTSQLGPQYFNFAEPNLQFMGYSWALIQKGFDVKGFIVDAILVAKGLLPGKSKNANLSPLARFDVYYKEENYVEYLEAIKAIQADIKHCQIKDEWYPNYCACVTKYGDCEYRKVCKEEKAIRQRILDADYVIEPWEPLKGVDGGEK